MKNANDQETITDQELTTDQESLKDAQHGEDITVNTVNAVTGTGGDNLCDQRTIAYLYGLDEKLNSRRNKIPCGTSCANRICRCLDEEEMALLRLAYRKDRPMKLRLQNGELKIYENNVIPETFQCKRSRRYLPDRIALVPSNIHTCRKIEIELRENSKNVRGLLRFFPAVRSINNIYPLQERKLLAYAWLMEDGIVEDTFRRFEAALIELVINTYTSNSSMRDLAAAVEKLYGELNKVFLVPFKEYTAKSVEAHPVQFPGYSEYLEKQIGFLDDYRSSIAKREKELTTTLSQAMREELSECRKTLTDRKDSAAYGWRGIRTYSYLFGSENYDVCMLYCVLREIQELVGMPEGPQEKKFYEKSGWHKKLKNTLKNPGEAYAIVIKELREAGKYSKDGKIRVLEALKPCFQDYLGVTDERAERFLKEMKRI